MAAIFKKPASLFVSGMSNIWVNVVDITAEIFEGRSHLSDEEFFEAGESFGRAASLAFLG